MVALTQGVPVVHKPSQYATDLQKSIQTVEDEEAKHKSPAYPLVIFGGMSGRLDQTMHTLHVLWQLAPDAKVEPMIMEPGEEGKPQPRGSNLHKRARTIVVSDESVTCIIPPVCAATDAGRDVLVRRSERARQDVRRAPARIGPKWRSYLYKRARMEPEYVLFLTQMARRRRSPAFSRRATN